MKVLEVFEMEETTKFVVSLSEEQLHKIMTCIFEEKNHAERLFEETNNLLFERYKEDAERLYEDLCETLHPFYPHIY